MSPKISKEEEKQIKNMAPPEGKAIVYIIRSKNVGKLVKFHVSANDTPLGYTKGKTFLYTILDPGMYTFVSKAENTKNIDVNVEAGQIYYLLQKILKHRKKDIPGNR